MKYNELPANHPLKNFPDRLQDVIDKKKETEHKTESQMREEMELTGRGSLSSWKSRKENDSKIPDSINVVKLAQYFDVSADWLLGLENENIRSRNLDVREAAKLTRLSDKAIEKLGDVPRFKSMSPEEADKAIKENKRTQRAWTDEEVKLLSNMIEDGSLLRIIYYINRYRKLAKLDALKRRRFELTGKREDGMAIGSQDGESEFVIDTNFSIQMEVEQHRAEKEVTSYTDEMHKRIEAAYKKIGEQNGGTDKANKKER